MTDNETIILLRHTLQTLIPEPLGYALRYQPTQQGRSKEPTVYVYCIGHKRYGWRASESVWNEAAGEFVNHETQPMETTLQFSCQQLPSTSPTALTSGDVLNRVAGALQSDKGIALLAPNAQVLRVTDIRTPYFKNDDDRFEQSPNFDIVIKHQSVWVDSVPQVTAFTFDMWAVPDII